MSSTKTLVRCDMLPARTTIRGADSVDRLLFSIHHNPVIDTSKDCTNGHCSGGKESRLLRKLDSKSGDLRCEALKTLAGSGAPGAVRILAKILKSDSPDEEKLLAIEAIQGIANRTGIYYEGIAALESMYSAAADKQPDMIVEAAKRARESISGSRIINTFPGSRIDDRILTD